MKQIILSACLSGGLLFGAIALAEPPALHDAVIAGKVKTKLVAKHLSNVRVDADTQGVVRLTGKAPTQDAIDLAAAIAANTEGVDAVYNSIVIAP